ncbi:flavin-containing monooxygenase [Sinomonas gamaensis]|uniref:flavin-containing monooxygenase n=1 Tax=Sinomonas gamaensis TaxID=2565624 RepID=UPI001109A3C9|nr:NAD(P)/FAD-dependent oxidoreductase [Sinomonas gamaensis]
MTESLADVLTEVDDLYTRDEYAPITEDDAFLERIVLNAELPALMVALAAVTGDFDLLRDDLRPPQPPVDTVGKPHGFMTEEQQAAARELALEALKRVRDEGLTRVRTLSDHEADRVADWLTNGADAAYRPLLKHDMALAPQSNGRPRWRVDDVAPGRSFSAAVVGSGVAGMATAYRLKQAGIDVRVFEKGHDVGGTWWKNTYPGVRLDTPNYAYSFSFAQRDDWPQQFSQGHEIHAYTREVAERGGFLDDVVYGAEVRHIRWDDVARVWELHVLIEGVPTVHRVNAVFTAVGQLDRPKIPETPGRDQFAGAQMHSAEWDHSVSLEGKRVAVVGTGASAYQIVPAIVDRVESLTVFQRSSPWMLPTPMYYDDMPDAVLWLSEHLPHFGQWLRLWQHWLGVEGRQHTTVIDPEWNQPGSVSEVHHRVQESLRALLAEQYADRPDLLPKVTPDYLLGGKRMLRDNGVWAASLKKPQTSLVTSGLDHFVPEGIVDGDGVLHELDVVVYATGFQASEFLEPLTITGRDGRDLHEYWGGDAKAYLGMTVPGFPNLFIVSGPNTGHVVNGSLFSMIEYGLEYALDGIHRELEEGWAALDLRPEVLEEFYERLDAASATKAWGHPSVHTWYKNRFGRVSQIWPLPVLEYWNLTRALDPAHYEPIR